MTNQARLANPEQLGGIAFDVLRNDFHRPIVDCKCNRDLIEDSIVDGIYTKQLPAMNKADVEFVCELVDDMIAEYGAA